MSWLTCKNSWPREHTKPAERFVERYVPADGPLAANSMFRLLLTDRLELLLDEVAKSAVARARKARKAKKGGRS